MRLKVLTTAFFLFGLLLMLSWPFLVGPYPGHAATARELARYGVRALLYFGATAITFLAAAYCALVLARRTSKEFVEQERENVKELVEGTLKDHERKKQQ